MGKDRVSKVGRQNMVEARAIQNMESSYMTERRLNTYLACEELNFAWDESEVYEFDRYWNEARGTGKSQAIIIMELAERFSRQTEEIAILALDRGMKGAIQ